MSFIALFIYLFIGILTNTYACYVLLWLLVYHIVNLATQNIIFVSCGECFLYGAYKVSQLISGSHEEIMKKDY